MPTADLPSPVHYLDSCSSVVRSSDATCSATDRPHEATDSQVIFMLMRHQWLVRHHDSQCSVLFTLALVITPISEPLVPWSALPSSDILDPLFSLPSPLSLSSEVLMVAGQLLYGEVWPSASHPSLIDTHSMFTPSAASPPSTSQVYLLELNLQKLDTMEYQTRYLQAAVPLPK